MKIIWDRKNLVRVKLRPYTLRYLLSLQRLHLTQLKLQLQTGCQMLFENNQKGARYDKTESRF